MAEESDAQKDEPESPKSSRQGKSGLFSKPRSKSIFARAPARESVWPVKETKTEEDEETKLARLGLNDEEYLGSPIADRYVAMNAFDEALTYFYEQQRRLSLSTSPETIEEETRFGCMLSEEEIDQLEAEKVARVKMKKTLIADMIFGNLIMANGVMMGLTTEGIVDEDSFECQVFEIVCTVLFTIEFLFHWTLNRQDMPSWCRALQKLTSDNWTRFDLLCIFSSWLDLVMTYGFTIQGGTSALAVLRVLRLMRLLRLVRLLKLLKSLWLLVSSMFSSVRVLFWAVFMLLMVSYIFGILFYELSNMGGGLTDEQDKLEWGGVFQAMLSLVQVATYNGIDVIRRRTQGTQGLLFLPIFFLYMSSAAMGVLNLIVGVLLTSVLEQGYQDDQFTATTTKLVSHRALRRLRWALLQHAERHFGDCSGGGDTGRFVVSRNALMEWANVSGTEHKQESIHNAASQLDYMKKQREKRQTKKSLVVRSKGCLLRCCSFRRKNQQQEEAFSTSSGKTIDEDLTHELPRLFLEAGISGADIDAVCGEMENLMGRDGGISIDDFIENAMWMKNKVHPLDIVGIMRGLWLIYERMSIMDKYFTTVHQQLTECSESLGPLLQKFTNVTQKQEEGTPVTLMEAEEKEVDVFDVTDIGSKQLVLQEHKDRDLKRSLKWFDLVFAVVLMMNAVMLGVEVSVRPVKLKAFNPDTLLSTAILWFLQEVFFVTVFQAEIVLRSVHHYQINILKEHECGFLVFPVKMWGLTRGQWYEVLQFLPNMFADKLFIFDLLTISVSSIDCWILRFVLDESSGGVLRLVGLVRMVRLVRLLHLVEELAKLIRGFASNAKLILRTLIMMAIIIYSSAILMVQEVGQAPETANDEAIQKRWGSVWSASMTLFTMATFSNWTTRVAEVAKYERLSTIIHVFSIIFLTICSLGIMNLITGVMVQAAFSIMRKENMAKGNIKVAKARELMGEVVTRVFKDMDAFLDVEKHKVQDRIKAFRLKHQSYERTARPVVAKDAQGGDRGVSVEIPEEDAVMAVCAYDDENYAEIKASFWASESEVGIVVHLVEKHKDNKKKEAQLKAGRGPIADPRESLLTWKGGKGHPVLILPLGVEEQKATTERILIFRQVVFTKLMTFRFGRNFGSVKLTPDMLPGEVLKTSKELEDLAPVDRELVTIRELNYLLQDHKFVKSLDFLGLRPDQALMVYQKLNVTGTERVKVADFINSILRMKRPVQGVDVAGAKSLMRRFVLECETLSTNSMQCNDCFRNITEKLRDAEIQQDVEEKDPNEVAASQQQDEELRIKNYHDELIKKNRKLEKKCAAMRQFVEAARKKEEADVRFEHVERTNRRKDDGTASVRSASPGWD
eukprot:TRINITY_DN88517_c0_g1_i1.p1 TRINITY_DN88517_c0_g1~~TRINITY_DN88517_c0_g1_i1.p1  ORF type:complete len:1368 (+),score=297.23 TRINITY_DN88517_c0_g1_i1:43-4104(+)